VATRLMGIETEYALTAVTPERGSLNQELIANQLIGIARKKLIHMRDGGSGIFLSNGSRLYVDCGLHPELATPECSTPSEVVRYVEAGHMILNGLVLELRTLNPGMRIDLFRCNVDYGGTRSTWGCHESYLHHANPAIVPEQIIPHLVTRIIYTGAGGFNVLANGLEFILSPRAPLMESTTSAESTHSRGIFHTKDESLSSAGYHRLHIIFGESLCSQIATFLKVGATALIVAMIDGGIQPARGISIADPVKELRNLAADTTCKTTVAMIHGQPATAIDVQRHYLEQAEQNAGSSFMPDWAADVCGIWRRVLDQLESASASACAMLDWAMKHALYSNYLRQHELDWPVVPALSRVVARLDAALEKIGLGQKSVSLEYVLSAKSPIPDAVTAQKKWMDARGLTWEKVSRYLSARSKLLEIDMRFGQLDPEHGIFAQLERSGVFRHSVPDTGDLLAATTDPPLVGRAHLRGRVIRQLAGNTNYRCDWQAVTDKQRFLDLSDPFAVEERWREFAARS
jgi:proteasome accessory factor A